ncbi:ring-1,2-phenylacetyl-CoA epoxidase subunit PaaE [Hydrobacter penzbergensis]|jgi:ring-1,2-phenylacetyl-CoA epoxidase subunit PaaE|uniref:Ring-1,2-phenylacetyl-CoA epoxidase subunit PaaE n=1 Tax=Hydrobacter penzbergensis TaxID=1235997 RepID=A0A8X8IF11_9BACT|nr:1,2-phenylacetyl-CoA epoxidase subunit PaaE [Hydrobacter penzbergensis]SDX45524.1 ring-1,2-phenylacetyl-CoA epoxidase subunit PaaE [Hydrobacter penzbergensis]
MSSHFHPLAVKEIRKETNDCVSIRFDIPDPLKPIFQYKQGQHITLRAFVNGQELRRSYSLCSSPLDCDEFRIAVKKIDQGLFSAFANEQLKVGDVLELMPPMGNFFTELHPTHHKQYVAFAAGSGITPLFSTIKTVLRTEPNSSFTLIYGNRNRHSIIFREELEGLKNKYIDRLQIVYILSREKTDAPINAGHIDEAKCKLLFDKIIDVHSADEFFICGPEAMIFTVKEQLEKAGVAKKKIHFELFSSPGQSTPVAISEASKKESQAKSKITVRLDGVSFDFDLGYDEEAILDAALKQGADLPYSCKGGVCCTCRAKLVEGEVAMDVNYGLEPEELARGFILTCQSHPRSARLVVDFDAK